MAVTITKEARSSIYILFNNVDTDECVEINTESNETRKFTDLSTVIIERNDAPFITYK